MVQAFPRPDSPDARYWESRVAPKLAKTVAEQRAKDLRYAANCKRLEIRKVSGRYNSFWEVYSVTEIRTVDGVKNCRVSMHRTIHEHDARQFYSHASDLNAAKKVRIL